MIWSLEKKTYPIGVDMDTDMLKMVQLQNKPGGVGVVASGCKTRPENIAPGSAEWQRWTVNTIKELTADGKFQGKDVVMAMSPQELFIEHVKMSKNNKEQPERIILSRIKRRFGKNETVIKHIKLDEENFLVTAMEREKIDRYLAVYETTHMHLKSIDIWPTALINSYIRFFGNRKSGVDKTVMLLDIAANYTNMVICRHKDLLLAYSVPIGIQQLVSDEMMKKLIVDLSTCRHESAAIDGGDDISMLFFLAGPTFDKQICLTIAEHLQLPAQTGDCFTAAGISCCNNIGIDEEQTQFSWATAFGLSLS